MPDTVAHHSLALFEEFPKLHDALPWISLGHWPTPVVHAREFGRAKGLPNLYVKREDLSHPHGAGNKVRGLEFLLADAVRRGASLILTLSAAGSHHICKTAWHARQLGIDTIALVVDQPPAPYVATNLLLGASVGTKYVPAKLVTIVPRLVFELLRPSNQRGGRPPLYIPSGGTTPLACIGHVNAAFELRRQIDEGLMPEPDYIHVALGSLGTAAGLALGCQLAGIRSHIVGAVVSYRLYATRGRWARIARRTLRLMRAHDPDVPEVSIDKSRLHVIGSALGHGYACLSEPAMKLSRQFHESEGIELDSTYTSKTLHGAMQFIETHRLGDKVHLFWNTYHAIPPRPDLLALADRLASALRRYVTS